MADDEAPRGTETVPEWYVIGLIALAAVGLVIFLVLGNVPGAIFAGLLVVAAVALAIGRRRRLARGGADLLSTTGYGSSTFFGVFWVAFGIWRLTTSQDLVFPALMVGLGLLTVAAFGPRWLRRRAELRDR